MATIVRGVRMVMPIAEQSPLREAISGEYIAPQGDSDEAITAHARATMQTLYHPVGTCRMGADDESVVDLDLRVRGVAGLRVVDASVIPTVPRGNTNAPVIAVAERAADLIRERAPERVAAAVA